jgi:ParB family chromosome partitioning protein
MDENRVEMLARQHGIRQKRDDGGIGNCFSLDACGVHFNWE